MLGCGLTSFIVLRCKQQCAVVGKIFGGWDLGNNCRVRTKRLFENSNGVAIRVRPNQLVLFKVLDLDHLESSETLCSFTG